MVRHNLIKEKTFQDALDVGYASGFEINTYSL